MAARSEQIIYQAQVTLPSTLARIQAAREGVERAGGKIEIFPTTTPGLTIVRLRLPVALTPAVFLPDIPFFPLER